MLDKQIERIFENNSVWGEILNRIYLKAPYFYTRDYVDDNPLIKGLSINGYELRKNIEFLEAQALVKTESTHKNIILEKKGFEVALENQKFEGQQKTNIILVLFTAVLAFFTATGIILQTINTNIDLSLKIVIDIVYIAFSIGIFIVYKTKKNGCN